MVGAIAVIGGEIVEISNNVVDYVALAGIEVRSKYFYDVGENTPFSPYKFFSILQDACL